MSRSSEFNMQFAVGCFPRRLQTFTLLSRNEYHIGLFNINSVCLVMRVTLRLCVLSHNCDKGDKHFCEAKHRKLKHKYQFIACISNSKSKSMMTCFLMSCMRHRAKGEMDELQHNSDLSLMMCLHPSAVLAKICVVHIGCKTIQRLQLCLWMCFIDTS